MERPLWEKINVRWPEWQVIMQALKKNKHVLVHDLSEAQKGYIAASAANLGCGQCLLITWNSVRARKLYEQLQALYPNRCYLLKERPIMLYWASAKSNETDIHRLSVLNLLARRERIIVIASVEALFGGLTPPERFAAHTLHLHTQAEMNREQLIRLLLESGYESGAEVIAPGQMSVRGGLVDVFPAGSQHPVRIEYFGDAIDSIRIFDVDLQRSMESVSEVFIGPARETVVTDADYQKGIIKLKNDCDEYEKAGRFGRAVMHARAMIEYKTRSDLNDYQSYFYSKPASLLDYLDDDAQIVWDEPGKIREKAQSWHKEFQDYFTQVLEQGDVFPEQIANWIDYEVILKKLVLKPMLLLQSLLASSPDISTDLLFSLGGREAPVYRGNQSMLFDDVRRWIGEQYLVLMLVRGENQKNELLKLVDEQRCPLANAFSKEQHGLMIEISKLSGGFVFDRAKTVVLTDYEIKGQTKKKIQHRKRSKFDPFTDLKPGDYVVHENHGIGQYVKIETLQVSGIEKDYLHIRYRGTDKLYVPIDQLELIQPYIGLDERKPKLSSLGGSDWEKIKKKTQESVQALAFDLVKLYAERELRKGFSYTSDTNWQRDFEDAFMYEETPDQVKSIAEIKADMESDKVMDRLLCGDVGYGKTEVAMRAAFKGVMDGKQVAVLAPTTVLVQQHLKTFKKRFEGFPVSIDAISRFKSAAQQSATLKDLKAGNIDIIIGTHRILGKDVLFKDLGLLIIDEEQRFGVSHKEVIKNLKNTVDVLTLTATPIPRTLHMSLVGIRDISVIETPPEERLPVQTYVTEYSDALIRDVLLRELGRGGQVYFVYNRVKSMERMAQKIKQIVPEAKILMAHGQMSSHILERAMLDFSEGEYDILLCSTIIENGLDISNVNTLIVHDADRFGLSQLYQMRGRVGRSDRAAYAYFTYDGQKILSETAEKRLKAIKEFTEFGSGFKIAMRDLEIRGAGNILGAEQHGHMSAVGYEMYCKLLEESVQALKGELSQEQKRIKVNVSLNVDAHIDEAYIADEKFRMDIYRKIAAIETQEDKMDVQDELMDRFGEYPAKTGYLIDIAYLKSLAVHLKISEIIQQERSIILQFTQKPDGHKMMRLLNASGDTFSYASKHLRGEIHLRSMMPGAVVRSLYTVMETLSA